MGQYEEQLQALTQSPGDFEGPHLLKLELAMMEVRERLADLRTSDAWTGKAADYANERITELSIECSQIEADVRAVRFALPDASSAVENARQAYHSLPSSWVPEWVRNTIDVAAEAGDALVRVPHLGTFAVGTALNQAESIFVNSREEAAREAITRLHQELEAPQARIAQAKDEASSSPGPAPTPNDDSSTTGGNGGGTGGRPPVPHFPGGTSPGYTPTSVGTSPGYVPASVPSGTPGASGSHVEAAWGAQPADTPAYTPEPGYSVDSHAPGYTYTPGAGAGAGPGYSPGGGTSGYAPSGHYGGTNTGLTAGLMGAGAAGSAAAMRAGTAGFGPGHGSGSASGASGVTGRGGILGRMGADGSAASARGMSSGGLAGGRTVGAGGLGTGAATPGGSAAATGAAASRGGGFVGGAPMGGAGAAGSSKKSTGARSSGLIAPRVDEEAENTPLPPSARAGSREAATEDH